MSTLVHLCTPADWRAALDAGALRPPGPVVHLWHPGQVHLPAARLHPGRRDLVLLVVDPARLPDPVREEPGADGTRSPRFHGPLPTSAVVAVVPYRPPAEPVLPPPDDALGRAGALSLSVRTRRAAEVRDVAGGVAVLDQQFPHSYDDNRLVLGEPVDAETIARTAVEVDLPHPAATLTWNGAGEVAARLAGRGWQAEELLVMARSPAPGLPGAERAEVVDQRVVHPLWEASWRRSLAGAPDLDEVVAQLVGREHRTGRVVAVHDVVVRTDGRVVAAGQLRVDGATAAVESVMTDPEARGRGHADAVLARALELAAGAGCDLVVLEADAADWPRHWYARRGFAVVGSVWDVTGPQPAGATQDSSR
ncbi:GNAT family N-acetyltransferase [Geodermatophilus sp. SYSU D00766]